MSSENWKTSQGNKEEPDSEENPHTFMANPSPITQLFPDTTATNHMLPLRPAHHMVSHVMGPRNTLRPKAISAHSCMHELTDTHNQYKHVVCKGI